MERKISNSKYTKTLNPEGGWTDQKEINHFKYDGIINRNSIDTNGKMQFYDRFSRFGFLDPYTTLTGAKEYLFFTKPDLNLFSRYEITTQSKGNYSETKTQEKKDNLKGKVRGATTKQNFVTSTSNLNPDLANYPFFIDLKEKYPKIGEQLQYSLNPSEPFMKVLSNSVKNTLDLPDISTRQVETAQTVYGTAIQYEADDFSTDEGFSFDLEFEDTKNIEVYMLFKTWHEYLRKKSFGLVEPIRDIYRSQKIIHDQIAIFKFIVAEDGETIVHYSKLYGCRPQGVPRSTFSDLSASLPIRFNVNWRAEFVEDMEPLILADFNKLSENRSGREISLFDNRTMRSNMEMADFARISIGYDRNDSFKTPQTKVYKLKWFKEL